IDLPDNRPVGYYMNLQFTSTGSHLAQGEGPWKMERNYRFVDGKSPKPLVFSVVNAGNIREFVMTMSANAKLLWDFDQYDTDSFLDSFCAQYFGTETAHDVAAAYRAFFYSYWQQKHPDMAGFDRQYIFQDMRYARAIEQITRHFSNGYTPNPLVDKGFSTPGQYFRIVPEDCGATNQLDAILNGTESSIAKLRNVLTLCNNIYQKLPPARRTFFNDNLRVQATFMLHLNETLNAITRAFMTLQTGADKETARFLDMADNSLTAARNALDEAEHGPFAHWYDGDSAFGIDNLHNRIQKARQLVP
ncbi:MAG: glycosyl hydrolase 115 family protein, partial [Candidatus Hydrogenedentes bacterium]|nr:glycosyl hydrolase 115 family protein [Candidatus Hydrogenedentota bacterium]